MELITSYGVPINGLTNGSNFYRLSYGLLLITGLLVPLCKGRTLFYLVQTVHLESLKDFSVRKIEVSGTLCSAVVGVGIPLHKPYPNTA